MSEDKTIEMNKEACKEFVAKINGLGGTLVMGHKAVYWDSAMDVYAAYEVKKELIRELTGLLALRNHRKFNIFDEISVRIDKLKGHE